MRLLKQNTAFTFRIGPFLDDTDGKTAETGLTIAQADIQISKNGGAFAQTSDAAPTTTHDADGWYQCPLTATDTNTLGPLTVQIVMAGALPIWEHFMVVPANVYDSLVSGSDYLQADAVQIEGGDATNALNAATPASVQNIPVDGTLPVTLRNGAHGGVAATITLQTPVSASVSDKTGFSLSAAGVSAVQSGLASQSSVDTVASYLDTEVSAILAAVDTEIATALTEIGKIPKSDGVVSWNATALGAIKTALEAAGSHLALIKAKTDNLTANPASVTDIPVADITAIKAKTDKMTYTSGNDLDVNVQKVNDVALQGDGSVVNPWGPA